MTLAVSLTMLALGAALVYKGFRGISWPELYAELAADRPISLDRKEATR